MVFWNSSFPVEGQALFIGPSLSLSCCSVVRCVRKTKAPKKWLWGGLIASEAKRPLHSRYRSGTVTVTNL